MLSKENFLIKQGRHIYVDISNVKKEYKIKIDRRESIYMWICGVKFQGQVRIKKVRSSDLIFTEILQCDNGMTVVSCS